MTLNYRAEIDGLRALAVISVIIFHGFPNMLPGGLIGVDVFFVISGYLITRVLIKSPNLSRIDLLNFYEKRVRRIFPALILTLIATYGFGWIALYADEFKELGLNIASGAFFLSNITYLLNTGYFDRESLLKPLLHLWSLGIEEQFYLIWPFLVFFFFRTDKYKTLLTILVGSLLLNLYLTFEYPKIAYFFPLSRFWELLVGSYLAFEEKKDGITSNTQLGLSGLLLIVISVFFVNGENNFPGWQAIPPVLGSYWVIKYGRVGLSHKILSNKLAVSFGLISYPLYLYHWPLFTFARITELEPSNLTMILLSLLAVFLSYLTYYLFERPIQQKGRRTTIILTLSLIIIGAIGLSAYMRNGLDFRQVKYELYKKNIKSTLFGNNYNQENKSSLNNQFVEPPPIYVEMVTKLTNQLQNSKDFLKEQKANFKEINQESYMCSKKNCDDSPINKPLVIIVGDSHAANLYTALLLTHKNLTFRQFTDSGCTPISSRYRDSANRCKLLLNEALNFTKANKVSLVIFAARWPDNFSPVLVDLNAFKVHSQKVAIAGASLIFNKDLEQILLRYDGQKPIQDYVNSFIAIEKFALNRQIKDFAKKNNIGFINKLEELCGQGFCQITMTGNELFIHDSGHLSMSGAQFLGWQLQKKNIIPSLMK
jgi:peptidoglycan/LPS O-acetylase OafA/YrhL